MIGTFYQVSSSASGPTDHNPYSLTIIIKICCQTEADQNVLAHHFELLVVLVQKQTRKKEEVAALQG